LPFSKSDPFYERLKKHIHKEKIKDIVFTGFVSDEELAALYDNAQAVIIPSLMEGFALPALEALSRNCIVIASDIPVIKEVCDDAVLYFDPKEYESLKERMIDVLTFPKNIESLKEKGQKMVHKYSWEKMAKETLEVYKKATHG
jgi:glycosyltransferase involved in cell wall biosynthesis